MPDTPAPKGRLGLSLDASAQDFAKMFRTSPDQAIAAWEKRILPKKPSNSEQARAQKGLPNPKVPWKSSDVLWHGHSRAFFVARMTRADILSDIHQQVDRAIREGRTFEQFRRDLEPTLRAKGWWSGDEPDEKKLVRNPRTGQDEWTRLGTPRRLKTIYQTNLAVSYDAGNYQAMDEMSDLLPYQQYHVLDHGKNRRAVHQALDGKIFRADDPALNSIRPRNGWGCQCRMDAITESMARRQGELPEKSKIVTKMARVGNDGPEVQIQGIDLGGGKSFYPDPQWAYDAARHGQAVEDLAWSKISVLPQPAQKAFVDSIAKDPDLLARRTENWKAWTQGVKASEIAKKESVAIGWMDESLLTKVSKAAGKDVSPVVVTLDEDILHALRPSKAGAQALTLAQVQEIPAILAAPHQVVWDSSDMIVYGPERASLKSPSSRLKFHTKLVFKRDGSGNMTLVTAGEVNETALRTNGTVLK